MQDTRTGFFHEVKDESEAIELESKNIPVFRVGEILNIKGARVRVRSIGRKVLTLEGLPGSQFAVEEK